MSEIKIYPSRKKALLYLLGSILMTLAAVGYMVTTGFFFGFISTFLFGAATVFYAYRIIVNKPHLIISDKGITELANGIGLIPWADIQRVYVDASSLAPSKRVIIEPKPTASFIAQMPPAMRSVVERSQFFTGMTLGISADDLTIPPEELVKFIQKYVGGLSPEDIPKQAIQFDSTVAVQSSWSWGGFVFTWLWGISNGVWISTLALIPTVNFFMSVFLGIRGRELAWNAKHWDSPEQFESVQKKWDMAAYVVLTLGVIAIIGGLVLIYLPGGSK